MALRSGPAAKRAKSLKAPIIARPFSWTSTQVMHDRVMFQHLLFLSPLLAHTQVSLGPGSGGGANAGQLRNIALCSQLQEVHRSMLALLPRLPAPAAAALQGPLDALEGCAIDTGGLRVNTVCPVLSCVFV